MSGESLSRRFFLKAATAATASSFLSVGCKRPSPFSPPASEEQATGAADYTLHIAATPVEIAPDRIISVTTYNGQFPGPLLRFKEGKQVTVAVYNETDTPEQLHWHGQMVPTDVDGSAEEGTPFIPAHGMRRIIFTPRPSGFRFYHTHVRAGANLSAGQYSGQVGPVYIEAANEAGNFDREIFLVLKEFEPTLSRGGDMAQDFLAPSSTNPELKDRGESSMKASLSKGMPHGFEVGYGSFTINGRMLGHGEPIRVKQGERILLHVLNGSATEIRSLALPGHTFRVIAMDGNTVPNPKDVPVLWIGTAERISAVVEMNHPGVWILGDLADDDRKHGMGMVVEYAGQKGKPQWMSPPRFRWNYSNFGKAGLPVLAPDETFEMVFAKDNAADAGFNRWTINGIAYPNSQMMASPSRHLKQGKRYRIKMRNASDDIHPIHLHRHTFEVTSYAGKPMSGLLKDVVMLGGYQEVEIDFVANNPGVTLFHCHQQLHMDFGFMTLFDYV
ncbi:MAG TPA: multicopper oxidase domain-containing protein [Bryobacteraceae bacterium]|jgi:FtsP/CotA-like multicopper oxidase with cupredoxin domain|nr:multicopper oxidase domain-containing protein [Bryobacteraceae bacterium]